MEWERQSGRFPRDPRLGHRTGCSYVPTKSNTSLLNDLYTSNDGFVSLTSSTHKAVDKNKKLVLILGGSVAMGLGASSNENTICANLQALLDESYPNQYCVINAACAAYCSWQELLRYTLELSLLCAPLLVSPRGTTLFILLSVIDILGVGRKITIARLMIFLMH